jgi:hypothetical protein
MILLRPKYRDHYGLYVYRRGEIRREAGGPFLYCLGLIPKDGSPFSIEHMPE